MESSVTNFKLNERDEIEFVDAGESEEAFDSDTEIVEDGSMSLVAKSEGVMTIRQYSANSPKHICTKCDKPYNTALGLKRHMNLCRHLPNLQNVTKIPNLLHDVHSVGDDAAKDDICFCCFEEISIAHHGFIACNFCPKSFSSHVHLERHLYALHSSTNAHACTICNAKCPNAEILELHVATHDDGKPFSCQKCGKDFTRKYHLDRHLEFTSCDKSRMKQQLPCKVCNKVFTRLDNLREHLRVHLGQPTRRKEYECPFCTKKFFGSSLLNIHIRTHTGERPFPCDLCENFFPSNGALRKHRRKHTGEKPYACTLCTSTFSVKETLNRHMKTHTGERPHKCPECSQAFIQATQLRVHMKYHSEHALFSCDICGLKFMRLSRLENHMVKVHIGVGEFKCDVCMAPYKSKFKLATHLKDHIKNAAIEQDKIDQNLVKPKRTYVKRIKTETNEISPSKNAKDVVQIELPPPKRRGRPPGSKTKVKEESVVLSEVPTVDSEESTVFSVHHVEEKTEKASPIRVHPIRKANRFECNECPSSFSTKANLELHKKNHSQKSADRPMRCKLCKLEFSSLSLLVAHMKTSHLDDLMTMVTDDDPAESEAEPLPTKRITPIKSAKRSAESEIPNPPSRFKIRTSNSTNIDEECNEYEVEIIHMKDEPEDKNPPPVLINPCDVPITLTSEELTDNISKLLNLLVDEQTLSELGWPGVECEAVLAEVIAQCGQTPADRITCPDYETVMRENAKLLFTTVISNDSIKSLLNNHSVDEVILHVLKLAS